MKLASVNSGDLARTAGVEVSSLPERSESACSWFRARMPSAGGARCAEDTAIEGLLLSQGCTCR